MTTDTQIPDESEPKLKRFLEEKSVSKVLFIDDGFDPIDQMEPTPDEQNDLWTMIEADVDASEAAQGEGFASPDDLRGETIAKLLARSEDDPIRRAPGRNVLLCSESQE